MHYFFCIKYIAIYVHSKEREREKVQCQNLCVNLPTNHLRFLGRDTMNESNDGRKIKMNFHSIVR